jgi:hypothetical protein
MCSRLHRCRLYGEHHAGSVHGTCRERRLRKCRVSDFRIHHVGEYVEGVRYYLRHYCAYSAAYVFRPRRYDHHSIRLQANKRRRTRILSPVGWQRLSGISGQPLRLISLGLTQAGELYCAAIWPRPPAHHTHADSMNVPRLHAATPASEVVAVGSFHFQWLPKCGVPGANAALVGRFDARKSLDL